MKICFNNTIDKIELVKYIENSPFVFLINNHISGNELCIIKNEISFIAISTVKLIIHRNKYD